MIGSWRHPEWLSVAALRKECSNYYFDRRAARRIVNWIERYCKHFEGPLAGQTVELSRYQKRILRRTVGWKYKETGYRVVRELLIFIPRKNGKSAFTSFVANYFLFGDTEPAPTIVCSAGSDEQARQVFKGCRDNVENDPILSQLAKDHIFKDSIGYPRKKGELKVVSSKADTKHGSNLSLVIIDELHVQPNSDLVDVLHTSTSARPQPLTIYLTTAGTETTSICYEIYAYGKSILKREIVDHAFFPVIYEATDKDDINDPKVWHRVNPNLGVSKFPDYIERELKKTQSRPHYLPTVRRLEFNQWTGKFATWMSQTVWEKSRVEYTLDDFKGETAFIGLDLSSNRDLTAVVAIVPQETGEIGERLNGRGRPEKYKIIDYYLFPYFWLPSESLNPEFTERDQRLLTRLKRYSELGYITLMDSPSIDVDEIVTFISTTLGSHFKIEEIVGDKWNAMQAMTQLSKLRFTTVEWGQGFGKMNSPTKFLESHILNGRIKHNGNPVLTWNLENTVVEEDAYGNKRPNKKKSTEKIDGIVATITAFGRIEQWEAKASVYGKRGMVIL